MHNQSDPVAPGLLSVFTPVGEDVFHIAPLRRTTIPGHRMDRGGDFMVTTTLQYGLCSGLSICLSPALMGMQALLRKLQIAIFTTLLYNG